MGVQKIRTAEHVSNGHPDKFCDQVADKILDEVLDLCEDNQNDLKSARTAIEAVVKENLLFLSGEVKLPERIKGSLDVTKLSREVWKNVGYSDEIESLSVLDFIKTQSPEIAIKTDQQAAGDQGIMIGYATDETEEMMPQEWVYAKNLCLELKDLRISGVLPWLKSDCKTQVTLSNDGNINSVIIAAQHEEYVSDEEVQSEIFSHVIKPIMEEVKIENVKINGTGRFVIGGPQADAGVVGRKIVVDAYGPRIPVGGGAYSGKDPTKVDRSAAYMARYIAKNIVALKIKNAKECLVSLAYCIGQYQPEMICAVTDKGEDVSDWVKEQYPDLSPSYIISSLGLLDRIDWSYFETASFGHYGRDEFPWEKVVK